MIQSHIIEVDADLFSAALRFVSKEDARPWLKGVHVAKDGTLCATNGHTLFAAPNAAKWTHPKRPPKDGLIINASGMGAKARNSKRLELLVYKDGAVSINDADKSDNDWNKTVWSCSLITDTREYPNYWRVVPGVEHIGNDPALLAWGGKTVGVPLQLAIKDLTPKGENAIGVCATTKGTHSAAMVTFGGREDCFAIAMQTKNGAIFDRRDKFCRRMALLARKL